jgi:hypothetical protein
MLSKKVIAATPLASIFGSGFLVIVPILHSITEIYSVFAMAVVCGVAYGVGNVIRFNIQDAEPLLAGGQAPKKISIYEWDSDLVLVGAYIISVCLYIYILSSFLLRGIGEQFDTPVISHVLTALIFVLICLVGYYNGLRVLAKFENIALATTLLIIMALFAGFATYQALFFKPLAGILAFITVFSVPAG